jgi:hypothetical protein
MHKIHIIKLFNLHIEVIFYDAIVKILLQLQILM